MFLLQPLTAVAAKTLASKAIETALENGTFKQVQQELMMDAYQKQNFEFDEVGVEALGRRLLAQGQADTAIEVLQLNQVLHAESSGAANAVADAYRESGQATVARVYYEQAVDLDPSNQHARQALQEIDNEGEDPMMGAMGNWELDPEAMQESMAQMGMEMSPEQMAQMQEAMEQLQQMEDGGAPPGQQSVADLQFDFTNESGSSTRRASARIGVLRGAAQVQLRQEDPRRRGSSSLRGRVRCGRRCRSSSNLECRDRLR